MANEVKVSYASQVVLESNGSSGAAAAFILAATTSLASANHSDFPLADFVLYCSFGAAVAATTVNLYRQDQDIDSTNDALAPSANYKATYVGSFIMSSGQSAAAYYPLNDVPISRICKFYIENATAQSIASAWTLKATPKTYAPGA